MSHSIEIGGGSTKYSLEVAFSVADVTRDSHPIPARQSRDAAFHPAAMLVVVFLEGLGSLSPASLLQEGIAQPDTQRAAFFSDTLQRTDPGVRFFTIDAVRLQTIYALFFIKLGSRRIHFAGVTSNPNQTWIPQQARQLVWELHDRGRCLQFLIHDNDCSFSKAFDAVFESEGISIIHHPFQTPNANAHAKRWVRTQGRMPGSYSLDYPC